MDAFVTRRPRTKTDDSSSRGQQHSPPPPPRAAKRPKVEEIANSASEDEDDDTQDLTGVLRGENTKSTEFENALPATQSDVEAAEEYESFKLSQEQAKQPDGDANEESARPRWIKGRSSIYVDAFNIALDTVLEEESHLFDAREKQVFDQWRQLDYQAQFMCASFTLPLTS